MIFLLDFCRIRNSHVEFKTLFIAEPMSDCKEHTFSLALIKISFFFFFFVERCTEYQLKTFGHMLHEWKWPES